MDTKEIYLTFNDDPTTEITEFVLDELKKHNAKATFFCIGKNIKKHAIIFKKILTKGHTVGNHTQQYLEG
jgi:peptidoglycan/xylan/chitin deacetylase (PgdA/CDA1 family)